MIKKLVYICCMVWIIDHFVLRVTMVISLSVTVSMIMNRVLRVSECINASL